MTENSRWARPDNPDQTPASPAAPDTSVPQSQTPASDAPQSDAPQSDAPQSGPPETEASAADALTLDSQAIESAQSEPAWLEREELTEPASAPQQDGADDTSEDADQTNEERVDETEETEETEETLSPSVQYVLSMRNSLFLLWLPLAVNASGCLGGKYLLQSARLQAIVTLLTLLAPVICLIGTIILDRKTMRIPAAVALAGLLIGATAIGGLGGAFELVGTWQMLFSDKDPNMKQLNSEVVNSRTSLVLYDYNPPLKRTVRILRTETVVIPGVIFAKKQQEKSD